MPMCSRRNRARSSSLRALRTVPATATRPEVGRSRPDMIIRVVVLPDPDGPTTARVSRSNTVRFTPFRILTSPPPAASVSRISSSSITGDRMINSLHLVWLPILFTCLYTLCPGPALAGGDPEPASAKHVLAFGDSLTAGYGLAAGDSFASRLEQALVEQGHAVRVTNAGVSGDTTG